MNQFAVVPYFKSIITTIAGVVNIITASPVPNNTVSGNILTSYQTNNRQRSLFANLAGNQHGFNWNVWGDLTKADDYKNKYDGKVFNSGFSNKTPIIISFTFYYTHFLVEAAYY